MRAWGRLGYPRRALRLHAAATAVTQRHGGRVPDDHEALLALPGIGAYTAAAVASFAFGRRHAVLDTNVRRVLARVFEGHALPARAITAAETRLAESVLPARPAVAARWAAASMELGALVCTARSPRCEACPVAGGCAWLLAGRPEPGEERAARPAQRWHGTDRQMRGRILAILREREAPIDLAALAALVPDASGQRERCLDSLVADGLVEPTADGVRLPAAVAH
ncbi:MAG: A/G-specific adenine glycosylase [Kineosporiaceae bacterium]